MNPGKLYTDPVEFARALANELLASGPNGETLLEHNADGIEDARQNAEAARILDDAQAKPMAEPETTQQASTKPVSLVVLKHKNRSGGDDLRRYHDDVAASLKAVGPDRMQEWLDANDQTIQELPTTPRLKVLQLIQAHQGTIGTALRPTAATEKFARDAKAIAESLRAGIAECSSASAIDEYIENRAIQAQMAKLAQSPLPELAEEVRAAATRRRAELTGGGNDVP
jgi:hypothetical protein